MNNINMTDIAHKIHFLYKDECERNVAAMVIFYNNGKYFFDEKHENEMTNDEVEALLLRGALVYKDDEYVNPSSFNNGNVFLSNRNTITLGNYVIQFNENEDTLDFLYNEKPEEPTDEIIPLSWVVGNLSSTGVEEDQDNAARSDFVAIEDNYDYTFYMEESMYDPSGVRVYFYNNNKEFISRTDGNVLLYENGVDIPIDMPSGTAYIRFKANTSGTTTADTIGTLLTLRKTKSYIKNGLSLYIDADDVVSYGSIRDITGNQTITNNGVTTTLDNGCLNFVSSESDYIDTGLVPNLTTWSAELYFYFTDTPTATSSVCAWGITGNKFRIGYSGSALFFSVQTCSSENRKISNIEDMLSLRHLIVTMDNGSLIAYLDGIKIELITNESVLTPHTTTMKIGSNYSANGDFANIHLKMFRFYDGKVLTEEEALQNYNYELRRISSIIKPTWIDNMKPNSSTGIVGAGEDNACTDFIPYDNSYKYTLSFNTVAFFRVYYYDSSKAYISNDSIANNFSGVINPPENTAYMRLKLAKTTVPFSELDNYVVFKKALAFVVKPTWADNRSINAGGSEVDDTKDMLTGYHKIDKNYSYTINYANVSNVRIIYYDSNKTYISRSEYLTSGSVDTLITFPENTAYFRIKATKNTSTVEQANDNVILKKVFK